MSTNFKRQSGVTLIELMISIAVLAILLSIAVPNFRTAIQNNRVATQGNELITAFQLARAEALKRRAPVFICASANGTTCGGAWNAGWIVAEDAGQPGTTNFVPADDGIVRVWTGLQGGMTLAGVDLNDAAVTAVRFLPRGNVDQIDRVFPYVFSLTIPDCRGEQARDISIARSGSVISERVECN